MMERLSSLDGWLVFGFVGQFLFFSRFVVQWIASEKKGESVLPLAFWYFSILGSIVLLFYAVHRKDPVFYVGYGISLLIYARNLALIRKKTTSGNTARVD